MSHADPPIVGLCASADGLSALQSFFATLPDNLGAAFVVVMRSRQDATHEIVAGLARRTTMPVMQVDGTAQLQCDHIYVIAPDRQPCIVDQQIFAPPCEAVASPHQPIDSFLCSLAEARNDAFAVLLAGAGAAGALGVKAIREAGGIVMAQDPREAEYASLPTGAVMAQAVDFVLPVRALADHLVALLKIPLQGTPSIGEGGADDDVRSILAHVCARTGHDFSGYKRATVLRRIARRTQINHAATLAEYLAQLREDARETHALFRDFLISVTSFFRDPDAFATLAATAIPALFAGKGASDTIRVWVPGCATGEEAYSIAMLLAEEAGRHPSRPEILVFGTDLDTAALATAREGHYPASIRQELSGDRLQRFFVPDGDGYRVRRVLRETVLFASHSLLKDPPFSHLDLLSCRNLLIYLERDLQDQVIRTFRYAIKPGGYLFVGASETVDHPTDFHKPFGRGARIYQTTPLEPGHHPALPMPMTAGGAATHRQIRDRSAPPSILVDEAHRVLHASDHATRFLLPSVGVGDADIVAQLREELRAPFRAALEHAFAAGTPTFSEPVPLALAGEKRHVLLQVNPIAEEDTPTRLALVSFIEGEPIGASLAGHGEDEARQARETTRQLKEELAQTQARLRTLHAESGGEAGQLRAANEALQSINEEFRSASTALESTRDITDRKRWEERQKLLLGELTHRIKNIVAVVRSLARLTLRGTTSAEDFVKRFEGRLTALSNAHGLLIDSQWQGAELGDLIRSQLQAYRDEGGRRIRIDGAPIMLAAELATPFGLIIHELATNAVKYGAWATATGYVQLSWRTIERDGERHLHFVWQEHDGPDVTLPEQVGFGSTLIQRSLPGAEVQQEFLREGLICTIDQPLDREGDDGVGT